MNRPNALMSSCRHVGGQSHCLVRACDLRLVHFWQLLLHVILLTPKRGRHEIMTSYAKGLYITIVSYLTLKWKSSITFYSFVAIYLLLLPVGSSVGDDGGDGCDERDQLLKLQSLGGESESQGGPTHTRSVSCIQELMLKVPSSTWVVSTKLATKQQFWENMTCRQRFSFVDILYYSEKERIHLNNKI